MLAMKKIVLAVSLIAAVTTVEGRNPLHGPPHSNETNSDGPDSIHGHHKVFEMSNPNSLNEDELYQLADFKTHKMISDVDFLRFHLSNLSVEEQCTLLDPVDGFCIESGDQCKWIIILLNDTDDGHCCCCCGPSRHNITTTTQTTTISTTTQVITTTDITPGCCDQCELMDGFCIKNYDHCDGIINIIIIDNEHCCCCINQVVWSSSSSSISSSASHSSSSASYSSSSCISTTTSPPSILALGLQMNTMCPEPFEEIGGCCYYFNSTRVSWDDARHGCHAMQKRAEKLNMVVDLAEVGRHKCNDVLVMEAVARKGASRNWFGCQSLDSGATWIWQRTEREFSKHSNMWLQSMPDNAWGNCVMAMNFNSGPERRAYFVVNLCDTLFGYTCQIF